MKYKIAVDVDGVLANFEAGFIKALALSGCSTAQFPIDLPSFPESWDWPRQHGATNTQVNAAWDHVHADPHFWSSLPLQPNASADIAALNEVADDGWEVYFITSRSGNYARRATVDWLTLHGMPAPTVLIADSPRHKAMLCGGLGIDAIVDDHPGNLHELPDYTRAFLFARPHNLFAWGGPQFEMVSSVRQMLDILDETNEPEQ